MTHLTKEQAIELAQTGWWKGLSAEDILMFQLFEDKLCMDWSDFKQAVEKALGRGVWTHEYGGVGWKLLQAEFLGDRPAPTWDEIMSLIPEEKRIIIVLPPAPPPGAGEGKRP